MTRKTSIALVLTAALMAPPAAFGQTSVTGGLKPAGYGSSTSSAARPTISVIPFETDRTGWVPPPNFGETVADLLASRLVDLGAFRVFDRGMLPGAGRSAPRASFDAIREIAQQSGVDLVVFGAVTKFSNEKTQKRGGLLGIPFLGGLGKNTQESALGLALRVVDVRTGEILTAMIADGAASKTGRTIGAGGLAKGVPIGALYSTSSTGSLDRLLNEALVEAVESAAAALTKAATRISGTTAPVILLTIWPMEN